jgi:LysR family transcriptional regulator, transcriptional activator of the cysJI operon
MDLDSTEAILSCIEAGLGVGIVSKWALDRRLRARTIAAVRIEGHPFARTFSFVLAQGPFVQLPAETLIRFLQAAVPSLPKVSTPELRTSKPPAPKPLRKSSNKNR